MYAHIEGTVSEKNADSIVIDAGGVGYEISASATTLSNCPPTGERAKLYTYLSVREDAMELFGFRTREEKRMFLRLIGVSGIGPRPIAAKQRLAIRTASTACDAGVGLPPPWPTA